MVICMYKKIGGYQHVDLHVDLLLFYRTALDINTARPQIRFDFWYMEERCPINKLGVKFFSSPDFSDPLRQPWTMAGRLARPTS